MLYNNYRGGTVSTFSSPYPPPHRYASPLGHLLLCLLPMTQLFLLPISLTSLSSSLIFSPLSSFIFYSLFTHCSLLFCHSNHHLLHSHRIFPHISHNPVACPSFLPGPKFSGPFTGSVSPRSKGGGDGEKAKLISMHTLHLSSQFLIFFYSRSAAVFQSF